MVDGLAATGLVRIFGGVRAVDGVSLTVAPGEVVALIGPNGAGKSTLFNMLSGQMRPGQGRVTLDGTDITGQSPRAAWRRGIGRTFQVAAVLSSFTVAENVQIALLRGRVWNPWRAARAMHRAAAHAALDQVGLAQQAGQAAGVLAYGDVKRLELAMALATHPRLLLMDEPTAGMASAERVSLMALIRRLVHDRGLAVLFTEHDMDAVFTTAGRVLVMDRGRIIASGPPAAIRADPAVRAAYLGT